MPILSPASRQISWSVIRKGIADCIKAAAPTARVHPRWAMRWDLQSTIAMIKEQSSGKIHSWMVSVKKPTAEIVKVGGTEYQYTLNIRIWGLMQYDYGTDSSNSQDAFEDEVDDVIATLKANADANCLGITNSTQRAAVREVIIPSEFDMDVVGFGEGYDIHVAQGFMDVRIVR